MERRSLLTLGAIGAAFSSGIGLFKPDHSLPHFEGVYIPDSLGPTDLNWLDRLNRAFAQRGNLPWQKWKAGYSLKWTGWKVCIDSIILAAQWVAYSEIRWMGTEPQYIWLSDKGHGFYSASPGSQGFYSPGNVFDITMKEGQPFLLADEAVSEDAVLLHKAALAKIDAYKRLLQTMREHGVRV
jgi:hypothetical protein